MINKKTKGFTIIELLVVIAIIAVLAAIVLVNVTQYIARSRDAAVQGNMSTLLTNSAVWFDQNTSYQAWNSADATGGTIAAGTACTGDPTFTGPCNAITGTAATGYALTYTCSLNGVASNCNTTAVNAWCGQIVLRVGGNHYCVDSTGNKVNSATTACVAATSRCS